MIRISFSRCPFVTSTPALKVLRLSVILSSFLAFGGVVNAQNPDYILSVEDRDVLPGGTFTIEVILDSLQGGSLTGWSYGICHDPTALSFIDLVLGESVLAVTGDTPDFFNLVIEPGGYAVGVVYLGPGLDALPPSLSALGIGTYSHSLAVGESTIVAPCGTIGVPPIGVVMVEGGISQIPITNSGTVTVLDLYPWIRGDANDDGLVDLADGLFLLDELFLGGPAGTCFGAKDANDDALVDTADAVYLFNMLFFNGPPPPAPYPECEAIPSEDCASQFSCF